MSPIGIYCVVYDSNTEKGVGLYVRKVFASVDNADGKETGSLPESKM